MFTLRRISGSGIQMNHILGDSYTVVTKEGNINDFNNTFKLIFGDNIEQREIRNMRSDGLHEPQQTCSDSPTDDIDNNVYAFVSGRDGSFIQPLWSYQKAFIMTSDGKTYDNLSFNKKSSVLPQTNNEQNFKANVIKPAFNIHNLLDIANEIDYKCWYIDLNHTNRIYSDIDLNCRIYLQLNLKENNIIFNTESKHQGQTDETFIFKEFNDSGLKYYIKDFINNISYVKTRRLSKYSIIENLRDELKNTYKNTKKLFFLKTDKSSKCFYFNIGEVTNDDNYLYTNNIKVSHINGKIVVSEYNVKKRVFDEQTFTENISSTSFNIPYIKVPEIINYISSLMTKYS